MIRRFFTNVGHGNSWQCLVVGGVLTLATACEPAASADADAGAGGNGGQPSIGGTGGTGGGTGGAVGGGTGGSGGEPGGSGGAAGGSGGAAGGSGGAAGGSGGAAGGSGGAVGGSGGTGGAVGGSGGAVGGSGGSGGAEGGAGGAGGACGREAALAPDAPMYDRYEGTEANNACAQDADCHQSGCSAEICAADELASTCEGIPAPPGSCGCVAGQCVWYVDACEPCPDADRDGLCDADDQECNPDGLPALCNRRPPLCEAGTVPEVRDQCYTDACVTWETCGVEGPPPPQACSAVLPGEFGDCRAIIGYAYNGDGTCGIVSGCGCDERCVGRVFESEAECLMACIPPPAEFCGGFGGFPCDPGFDCVDDPRDDCDPANGGADCGGICVPAGCPDADSDGRCDADDSECNADGSLLMCRRAAPPCPRGTVPEVRNGCYTNACVTWEQCGDAIELPVACVPVQPGEFGDCEALIGVGVGPDGSCQAISGCGCNAACTGRVFDTIEACEASCGAPPLCAREAALAPGGPMYDRYEGTGFANACRGDADCFTGGCSGEVCSAEQGVITTCELIAPAPGACGCVEGQCLWFVEACGPVGQSCGGFIGAACPRGQACVDDPNDDCDPRNGGADCSGVCVPER